MTVAPTVGPVILAVGDDPIIRDVFRLLLEHEGHLLEADGGADALKILEERSVDLMVLDKIMPGVDGLEVLHHLREGRMAVQVIVVSAVDRAAAAVAAMKLGAVDYITKPFDGDDFVAAVRRALAERPAHRAPDSAGRLRILVVGGDVGVRAALALVLSTDYVVDVVPSVRNVPPTMRPDLLLRGESAVGNATLGATVRDRAQLYLTLTAPLEFSRLQRDLMSVLPRAGRVQRLGPLTRKVIEHVSRHYAQTNVELTAQTLGLSVSRVAHVFKDEMATTVKSFIMGVKIQAAKYLLRETSEKIETLAGRVGLYDAAHLSRVFRRYAGCSPGKFRRAEQLI